MDEAVEQVTLDMTNAGWSALKAVFQRFGINVMDLPFDHSAGFINSDAPMEIYLAMRDAALKTE